MKRQDEILGQLDEKIIVLKPAEKSMVYFAIIALFGVIIYYIVYPKMAKKETVLVKKYETLKKSNDSFSTILKQSEEKKQLLKEVEHQNEAIKIEIDSKTKALAYIDAKISKQNSIKFSHSQWGAFIKTVQTKANTFGIKLLSLSHENIQLVLPVLPETATPEEVAKAHSEARKEFRPIFSLTLDMVGDFKNIMDYLVALEKNVLVTNIQTLSLKSASSKKLSTKIQINLWGIR